MTVSLEFDGGLMDVSTRRALADISLAVAKCKKIVVVTGAGISCSSGIPDFRSSDGLYAMVKERYPNVVLKGRDLFDASLFRDTTSTSVFYTFISQLKNSIDKSTPTPTHHFIKTLDKKNKLLRSYTQNVDGLEERAGLVGSSSVEARATSSRSKSKINIKEVRNVQLHGDIHRVRCISCSADYLCTVEHLHFFNEGLAPPCPDCGQRSQARVARSARATKVGSLRPAIVLYDEPHPLGDDIGIIQTYDLSKKPDMLIIMGTSLKVHGLKKLVKDFAKAVHAQSSAASNSVAKPKRWAGKVVFVNKTAPGGEWADIIDYHVSGETDAWVSRVEEDWRKSRPSDWEIQTTLDGDVSMTSPFKVGKDFRTGTTGKGKGKDARHHDNMENVPPSSFDIILGTPDLSSLTIAKPICVDSPGSPTKRRQGGSHYNDLESSPSKRRTHLGDKSLMPAEERGLLFGGNTANNVIDEFAEIGADLSMQDVSSPPRPKPKSKLAAAPLPAVPVAASKKLPTASLKRASSRRRLQVEVLIPVLS